MLFLLVVAAMGCSAEESAPPISEPIDPAARFSALEARLLESGTVRFNFHVTAEGAVEADIRGALDISDSGGTWLKGEGHFGGQPVDLKLRTTGDSLNFGNGPHGLTTQKPSSLNEAILIGFTRMGILHNLARLTAPAPPDHAEGGVHQWVVASRFTNDAADSGAVVFDLTVAEEPAGFASLRLDSTGSPVVRRQTVQFPTGEMHVVEQYSAFVIKPSPGNDH